MDDQRLEEIARKAGHGIRASVRELVVSRTKSALREALSSQEEELRRLREERDALDRKLTFNEIGARALQAQKEAADMRAEDAEAELRRLRDQIRQLNETVSIQAYELTQYIMREER